MSRKRVKKTKSNKNRSNKNGFLWNLAKGLAITGMALSLGAADAGIDRYSVDLNQGGGNPPITVKTNAWEEYTKDANSEAVNQKSDKVLDNAQEVNAHEALFTKAHVNDWRSVVQNKADSLLKVSSSLWDYVNKVVSVIEQGMENVKNDSDKYDLEQLVYIYEECDNIAQEYNLKSSIADYFTKISNLTQKYDEQKTFKSGFEEYRGEICEVNGGAYNQMSERYKDIDKEMSDTVADIFSIVQHRSDGMNEFFRVLDSANDHWQKLFDSASQVGDSEATIKSIDESDLNMGPFYQDFQKAINAQVAILNVLLSGGGQ